MADKVTLFHPVLRTTIQRSPTTAEVFKKYGWTDTPPRRKRSEKKEAK